MKEGVISTPDVVCIVKGSRHLAEAEAFVDFVTGKDAQKMCIRDRLSGGQQQRVALARALVIEPSVLLFDEPLSNLDAKLRVTMRTEIRKIQQKVGITAIYVTHDQSEAMSISDKIIICLLYTSRCV